jgi:hypothetical protein
MAVRVASAAAVASAPGSPASPMVGAPAIAASAARITVRDDLTVADGTACQCLNLSTSIGGTRSKVEGGIAML